MRIAIITIVQNGHQFIRIWYQYYSKWFAPADIFILDFGTDDGSLDGLHANIIKPEGLSIERVTEGNAYINKLKAELLQKYSYVIYADYDEIIYYSDGLDKLVDSGEEYYTTQGYEIVQKRDIEGPIDWTKPLLEQRAYWYRCPTFDKSLITRVNFSWAPGNHSVSMPRVIEKRRGQEVVSSRVDNVVLKPRYIPGLYLLHLHKIDYSYALAMHQRNAIRKSSASVGGFHNFFDGEEFERWYQDAEKLLERHSLPGDLIINK